jgi:superfamily II DNA/RNA helicase
VLADLKSGKLQALIATDIAARGLDITGLTHVVNYDLPDTPETYVHRIGRTGRAGETGTAITLISTEDEPALRSLQNYLAGRRESLPSNAGHSGAGRNGDSHARRKPDTSGSAGLKSATSRHGDNRSHRTAGTGSSPQPHRSRRPEGAGRRINHAAP